MRSATDAELQVRLNSGRQMLDDAAALAALCADHWEDEERLHSTKGERLHYAVDTALIGMYAQPQLKLEHRPEVFAGAPEVHEHVVALLGDLVMRRLNAETANAALGAMTPAPLITLPPHDEESRRVSLAIVRDVAEAMSNDTADQDRLRAALADAVANVAGETDVLTKVLGVLDRGAPSLAAYLRCESPTELLRLLPRGRLVPPAFHPAFGNDARQLRCPPPALYEGRLLELRTAKKNWYDRLSKGLKFITPDSANKLQDDAWALAYLEWVNKDAHERRTGQRVVLITASTLILEAGRGEAASHAGFKNFTAAYLRDARALLGAKHCFAPAPTSETQFRMLEFLSVLFPEAVQQARSAQPRGGVEVRVKAEDAQQLVQSTDIDNSLNVLVAASHRAKREQDGNFPAADLGKWREVVSGTLAQIVAERRQQRQEPPLPGLESGKVNVKAFLDELVKRVQLSFADLYLSIGVIGLEQLLEANTGVRGLPALRFDENYPGAQQQAKGLSDLMFRTDRDKEFNLAALYAELGAEDDSNYHAHVLHAFVYASSGKWFQARTLCRVALAVVDAIPPAERRGRLGREAAYLMAVAERRLAANVAKLSYARAALADARSRSDDRPHGPGTAQDVRFEAEAFAQDVSELQMRHFTANSELVVDVATLVARAHGLATLVDTPSPEPVDCVRHWVIRQAVTNGLIAALIGALRGQRFTHAEGSIRQLLARLSNESLAPSLTDDASTHAYPDEVSDFIWLIAAARWGEPTLRARARDRLQRTCTQQAAGQLPLESQRHDSLLKLVGVHPRDLGT